MSNDNSELLSISIASLDGTIVCASDSSDLGTNIAGRQLFVGAAQNGFAVGDPSASDLPIALSRRSSSDNSYLVAVAMLSLDSLTSTMSLSRLPADAVGVIFDGNRSVLARVPSGATIQDELFAPVTPDVAPSRGGVGLVEAGSGADRRVWAVADLQPAQNLYVAIGVSSAAISEDADANLWRGLAILVAVFIVASFVAWLFGELSIGRPLDRLTKVVAAMRAGDYTVRNREQSSARELRDLELSFNEMAGALEARDRDLRESNANLQRSIGEREMLVREMNHRVKNSLQLVSSVVGLQLAKVANLPAGGALQDAQARIAAIAKVHERLYAGARLDRVDAAPYLKDLCKDLFRTLAAPDRSVKISVRAAGLSLPPDEMIPIGMIVCELVTNSIKHAGAGGTIAVFLEPHGENFIALWVTDRGPGLPTGFTPDQTQGLGLRVASALAQQLGSELKFERTKTRNRIGVIFPSKAA